MKKYSWLVLACFMSFSIGAQQQAELKAAVDTTSIRIGEQLNYTLQIKADSTAQVLFPEQPIFAPFELLEESPIDTLRAQSHYLYTKKYALIQFDSGNYFLPQQQVLVDGFSKIADLIPIRVNPVVVDTTKQNLFDIKPLTEVEKNYDALISRILWGLVIGLVCIGIMYTYLFQKRKKELRAQELPPFERAIEELKALESENLSEQEEFKRYYSRLTDVVRRYLEEEAKIDALESTSEELLAKLELRKDAGSLDLDRKTLMSLRAVLQNADLVKFAKSMPEKYTANEDRKAVEHVVIETKEALPEPTEEELREKAAYQEYLAKKRRKEQWIWGSVGVGILAVLSLVVSMLVYGYYPVRDTLFRYPTKVLSSGTWYSSQYGTPPLAIETPEILERISASEEPVQQFRFGSFDSPFYINLSFDFPKQKAGAPDAPPADPKQADLEKGQELVNSIISSFESAGAVNIFIKNDAVTLPSGLPVAKIYGTLDYPKNQEEQRVRCNFSAYLFAFDQGTILLTLMYEKEDRYGEAIEQRILNSLDLIKEL
jgi:Mg2+ and Co2+ transporter CorA